MRDSLPKRPLINERGIVNLQTSAFIGSHWVCYRKKNNYVVYFDSFGLIPPPHELISYFGNNCTIVYNHDAFQTYNSFNCGHLCLLFLKLHDSDI